MTAENAGAAAREENKRLSRASFAYLRRRLVRNKLSFIAICAILLLVLAALLAPWIVPFDPDEPDASVVLQAPSWVHWLGTDDYGRDELSRVIIASRVDLIVPFASTLFALAIGSFIGAISGFRGGWLDQIVMRIVDAVMAFPAFVLAMGMTAAMGNSLGNLIIVIGITQIPVYLRQLRAEMMRVREMEYAEAALTVGNPTWRIVFVHLFPNRFPPLIVQATLNMGFALLTLAALSYIGLGIQPPDSEWGEMTSEGASLMVTGEWWLSLFPGLAILLTVLIFNLVGDYLRDILDPQNARYTVKTLLEVEDLVVHFDVDGGVVQVLDGVTFSVRAGEILGLVGESGSGKSITATAVLGMIRRPGRIISGAIRFEGVDLVGLDEERMREYRGRRIAMISQSPRTALNPVISIGRQIARLLEIHEGRSRAYAWRRAVELLDLVGVNDPARRMRQYAHQLSGGMCQRVMIAMALATSPQLLIADEPTTGLDVSIAARILDLLRDLGGKTGAAIILITHDLAVVAETCHRVAVMHAGQLVETAPVRALFHAPAHPYTRALVRSIPRIDAELRLDPIPGSVPSLRRPPAGCRYQNRCPSVMDVCRRERPPAILAGEDHRVACFAVRERRDAAA